MKQVIAVALLLGVFVLKGCVDSPPAIQVTETNPPSAMQMNPTEDMAQPN